MNLFEVAKEISDRLTRIFLRDERGRRAVYGGTETFQMDPHWRDHILFYEYFHGDNGAGLGASHQTGWTGVVAWFVRRTYYLLQMPGWSRRLRIMTDWTFALLFRADVTKLTLDSEAALLLREVGADTAGRQPAD